MLFDWACYLPAMVAAVSSSSSRSFSSCRFSSSLWCFLCSSSITFWWDSSMAAKPLSQVAYETGKTCWNCEFMGRLDMDQKVLLKLSRENLWALQHEPVLFIMIVICFQQITCKLQLVSHKRAEPVWVQKGLRGMTGYTINWRNA